jgi:hypothetical protein
MLVLAKLTASQAMQPAWFRAEILEIIASTSGENLHNQGNDNKLLENLNSVCVVKYQIQLYSLGMDFCQEGLDDIRGVENQKYSGSFRNRNLEVQLTSGLMAIAVSSSSILVSLRITDAWLPPRFL